MDSVVLSALDGSGFQIYQQVVAGQELPDILEECIFRIVEQAGNQEGVHDIAIRNALRHEFQQLLYLGTEGEEPGIVDVIEWLNAEAIARTEQQLALTVVDGKGPHAVELMDTVRAPLGISGQDDLGIGIRDKIV